MKKICPQAFVMGASALLLLVSASSLSYGQQGCGCQPSLGQQFRAGYDSNVQWPRHYIPPARNSVCATYAAMVNNGWRRQNLLGDYHFNPQTNQLTNAGKMKVNWILTQAPQQRRNVFVQRAGEEMHTTVRIASVHDYAGNISPGVGQVNVNDTHIVAEGHAAGPVDNVFVKYEENRVAPVLPVSTSGSGGSN